MLISSQNLDLVFNGFKTVYNQAFDGTKSYKDTLAMSVSSQSREEQYGWLGQFPALRKWVGDRHVKALTAHGFTIANEKFEGTVSIKRDDISDDRLGIYKPFVSEMGRNAKQHPETLIFQLLMNGFETVCFDGQNFFDTDHPKDPHAGAATVSVSNMQAGTGPAWYLLDLSKIIKPIIWQEREPYEFQSVTDDKEKSVFMTDVYLYGIRARVNCGFGMWQLAFGSKAPLNAENYAAARAAMSAFEGDQGHKLGITPTHLVIPSSLETEARTLLIADDIDGSSNIWKGSAEMIMTPWLS